MKKILLLATASLMISGVCLADSGKKKAKGKTCSSKESTCKKKDKDKTAKL